MERGISAKCFKTKGNKSICRACLRTIYLDKVPFYHIDSTTSPDPRSSDTIKQKFAACMPEVALEITVDAIICGYCAACLHWTYEFRKNCLKTEESIYSYVTEVGGDIYKVDLEQLLKWKNYKTLKKLEFVEVVSDAASADWDAEIQVYNDVNVVLHSVKNEIEVKEELLLDESEVPKSLRLESSAAENFGSKMNDRVIHHENKSEEIQVKEELSFVDVGKLNEGDTCGKENTPATNKILSIEIENETSLLNSTENFHTCNVCQKRFSLKCDFRLHMILHSNNTEPYGCDACEFTSPNAIILRHHLLISHTKELEFKCKACGSKINDFDSHDMQTCVKSKLYGSSPRKKPKLQNLYTLWELYKCDLCDFQCAVEPVFLSHKKFHEMDRNYTCNICLQSFKEKLELVHHLNVHNIVEEDNGK